MKVSNQMKKLITTLFLCAIICNLSAEISVKSFRKLENDMTARIDARKTDQNGDVCAIIKVVTTQTGFIWEPDGLGIVSAENKGGEYWLYVPFGAKRMTIKHPQLGVLRDYMYNMSIEKACVYEMVLTTGKVITTVEETIESQWLLIRPTPTNGLIYIDNQFVSTGEYQVKLKPGKYTYRVEAPLYHNEAGIIEISNAKKELTVNLLPAFGYVQVSSNPEQGAKIIIDNKEQSGITPSKSEAIASGEHTVRVVKEMYQPATQKVIVTDGQTTPVNFTLQPNFAQVSINTIAGADIFINEKKIATGIWNGRLNAGVYSMEVRLDKYRPAKQDIELMAGDIKKLDLQPTPIYGSLDVITKPSGATISINGKDYGTTPNTIEKLLIGNYTLTLSSQGYATVTKTIIVDDGKATTINETLANGKPVIITSTPTGATLYIDGNASGTTPYNGNLTFGNHTLRIEQGKEIDEKTITIQQVDGRTSFDLSFVSGYSLLGKEELKRREIELANKIEKQPKNTYFLYAYAVVLYLQDNFSIAKFYMEKAIDNMPVDFDSSILYEYYGDILYKTNNNSEAIEMWQKSCDEGNKSEKILGKIKSVSLEIKQKKLFQFTYYVFGSHKELQEAHIINSDGLLNQNYPKNYFVKINPTNVKSIPLYSSKASILTNHLKSSYAFVEENGKIKLSIIEPVDFWSESEYLVIVVED